MTSKLKPTQRCLPALLLLLATPPQRTAAGPAVLDLRPTAAHVNGIIYTVGQAGTSLLME